MTKKPRLSVYKSNKHIWAQLINDEKGTTMVSFSDKALNLKGKKTELAFMVGEGIAKAAKLKKVKEIVFDRGPYRYQGRIKAVAEGARKGGLIF
jgi:large subunit ribosomal protein L18